MAVIYSTVFYVDSMRLGTVQSVKRLKQGSGKYKLEDNKSGPRRLLNNVPEPYSNVVPI
jgi:hypothetical protein